MPTLQEVQDLQRELETLKDSLAQAKGSLERVREESGFKDLSTANKQLAKLKAQHGRKVAEIDKLIQEYHETYDAHTQP